jgi:hypothetical protein
MADVEVLTSMAVLQAVATWQPVEVSNGPYHVKVTPRSKMRSPNCALLHRVVRKQGKIVRDHLLKKCDDDAK